MTTPNKTMRAPCGMEADLREIARIKCSLALVHTWADSSVKEAAERALASMLQDLGRDCKRWELFAPKKEG